MARKKTKRVFSPQELAIVHAMVRVVRRCFLIGKAPPKKGGDNPCSSQGWIENPLSHFAAHFGIDNLPVYSITSP